MKISQIITSLEQLAHPSLQESYDNSGLLTGSPDWDCTGVLCTLDSTDAVISEAIESGANLVVAHHPIIFSGLKRLNGRGPVQRAVILAIKHDIAIYAIHTNLDNRLDGVNARIAEKIGLGSLRILDPRANGLKKLQCFVPAEQAEAVRSAMFRAGAGNIGNYDECSFNTEGTGTFRAGSGADPFVGTIGERHTEREVRIELVLPSYLEGAVVRAMRESHPYEEVAFDLIPLGNSHPQEGAGVIGELDQPISAQGFLAMLKTAFGTGIIRHTTDPGKPIRRVAVCGGAGSFLISKALAAGADAYVTADLKYHDFFDSEGVMLLADLGHFESEQFTTDLLAEVLVRKFPNFAVLKTRVNTNPVRYFH